MNGAPYSMITEEEADENINIYIHNKLKSLDNRYVQQIGYSTNNAEDMIKFYHGLPVRIYTMLIKN